MLLAFLLNELVPVQSHEQLIRVLQTSVSPAVLISGVGLLVLSLTNRFSLISERARSQIALRREADPSHWGSMDRLIRLLFRRSRTLLLSTTLALVSVLLAALLIMTLFIHYLWNINLNILVAVMFVCSMVSLVSSLLLFVWDMMFALQVLREDLRSLEQFPFV